MAAAGRGRAASLVAAWHGIGRPTVRLGTQLRRSLHTSTDGTPVAVAIHPETRSATITMQQAPGNAVTDSMLKALLAALDAVEADRGLRGVMLTSSVENFYSVGISLDMFTRKEPEWLDYWHSMRTFFYRLLDSRLTTIALVNGHAPGAGAIFSLGCHYRYMLRNNNQTKIGLNEVAVGLPVPLWLCQRMALVTGHHNAERLLPLGKTLSADEALQTIIDWAAQVGLVDAVFDTREDMVAAADALLKEASTFAAFPQHKTRQFINETYTKWFKRGEALDLDQSWIIVSSPEFQAAVKSLQAKLASKKKN